MFGFRYRLPENFFQGATDVHCHLLPGVDDGFSSTEKSLQALKKLEERGVKSMILTPHFMKDYPENNRESITAKFEAFKKEAERESKIQLRLGAEYMLDACFMDHFKQGFLTLDKGGTHVLCETSYLMYEHNITEMLYEIMCDDFQPVMLSLAGAYGKPAKVKAHYLLKEGMYDYVGSDMHGLGNFERFLPEIRLSKKNIERLEQLIENNKKLFN